MIKKIFFIAIISFMFMGVVSAANLWGSYKGLPVVRVKISGAIHKSTVPAINFNNQTYLPLNVLDKAGIKYKVDSKNQTIEISKGLNDDDIRGLGAITFTPIGNSSMEASVNFNKIGEDENEDWPEILGVFKKLSKLEATNLRVNYYKNDSLAGSISIGSEWVKGLVEGRNTENDLLNMWSITGKLFRPKLSAKEIAKLMDRVGYVESYNTNGTTIATGSGFIIEGGMFITNNHVVDGGVGIKVKLDGTSYDNKGWYWMVNETKDLFGVYLSTSYSSDGHTTGTNPSKYLSYQSELPEVGDKVYAIGSPLGLENSISEGIVSGIRTIDGITKIQHTADIDHGSSGGALLNEYGDVVGVTSSGVEGSNLEFAIPIKYVLDELK
jgi:S1-C subfamily serine protease